MTFVTRLFPTAETTSDAAAALPPVFTPPFVALNPFIYDLARPARAVPSHARLGEVTELLRVSPYRAIPVVETGVRGGACLVGLATERVIADTLLAAQTPEERARLRSSPIHTLMVPPHTWLTGGQRATDAAALFNATGEETLPVVAPAADGTLHYLGLLSRSDLVEEMSRPFRPPQMGGLATPTGVYLTTGAVSGGVGTAALVGSGLALWASHTVSTLALTPLQLWAKHHAGFTEAVLGSDAAALLLSMGLYLALVRLSPIAGFHAAEHQVVHAVERGEPLLVENVRAMPRVHSRCGTNLVAGLTLFALLGSLLPTLIGHFVPSLSDIGWVLAGLIALTSWRAAGAWLQQYVTTRPASDGQIESGIRAAREVLARHSRAPETVPRPHQRLWRLGFTQILLGYIIGYAVIAAVLYCCPALNRVLSPLLPL